MQQKNFLLAMGLIVSFLLLWSLFVVPRFSPPPVQPTATPIASPTGATTPAPTAPLGAAPELEAAQTPSPQTKVPDTYVRDDNNEVLLTSVGGAVKSWKIKSKGQEVDLVLHPGADPLPLTSFPQAAFRITTRDRGALMETTLPNGVRVTKTLTLSPDGHLHQLSYRFQNTTGKPVELTRWEWGWGPGLGTSPGEMKENAGLIRALTLGKLKIQVVKSGTPVEFGRWAGIDNRYYLVAFVPKTPHPVELAVDGAKEKLRVRLLETTLLPPNGMSLLEYELYVGPKGYTQLKKYERGLEASVDFGIFSWLGKLILSGLNYLKKVTGNYGMAIILLTIGLQTLLVPLTAKSFKATMAMKKLQPKIAELQARFKGDPKRLNIEMMNLYKTSGTNPFGGCLPMLLQLPIFWALFTTLRNAYELRGAPFAGWITDLSAPDVLFRVAGFPLHALPLIMGGTMFLQQRMSGAVTDPTQKQMMTIMPVMFTFMFYGFPSGLVLYWLTNNVMTITFQYIFQRLHQGPSSVVDTSLVK